MKKYFYLILAIVASVAFSSCSKDGDSTESEYMFSASFQLNATPSEEAEEAQADLVTKALLSAGFSAEDLSMNLIAPDSATASQILLAKMAKVESEVNANMSKGVIIINVKGAEKKNFNGENDKDHPISVWYSKVLRSAVVTWPILYVDGLPYKSHDYRWVKWIRSEETSYWHCNWYSGDYYTQFGNDTNNGAGGDYVWLILEHSGKSGNINAEFQWEEQFASTYITDVIGIYGGGEPQTLRVDGRTYKKLNKVADLNKKASGEYIWLYATTDPYIGLEDYYLITGAYDDNKSCRTLTRSEDFAAKDHRHDSWVHNGHRVVERVVGSYDTKGVYQGELDTNKGHGGDFVRIIMTYASKSNGY